MDVTPGGDSALLVYVTDSQPFNLIKALVFAPATLHRSVQQSKLAPRSFQVHGLDQFSCATGSWSRVATNKGNYSRSKLRFWFAESYCSILKFFSCVLLDVFRAEPRFSSFPIIFVPTSVTTSSKCC